MRTAIVPVRAESGPGLDAQAAALIRDALWPARAVNLHDLAVTALSRSCRFVMGRGPSRLALLQPASQPHEGPCAKVVCLGTLQRTQGCSLRASMALWTQTACRVSSSLICGRGTAAASGRWRPQSLQHCVCGRGPSINCDVCYSALAAHFGNLALMLTYE